MEWQLRSASALVMAPAAASPVSAALATCQEGGVFVFGGGLGRGMWKGRFAGVITLSSLGGLSIWPHIMGVGGGPRERGGQVESRLQEMGAGSESRGHSRVRVVGGTRPGAEFAGQARRSEDQAPAFCISAPHLAGLPSRSQFYFAS